MPGKHGPNRLAKDLAVHKRAMADLVDEGFVVEDQCHFTFQRRAVLLQGTILCLGGITLEVEKEIAVLKGSGMTAQVQTTRFRYHAWVRGRHNVLRYESGHKRRPLPHKHTYNTFGDGVSWCISTGRRTSWSWKTGRTESPSESVLRRQLRRYASRNAASPVCPSAVARVHDARGRTCGVQSCRGARGCQYRIRER